MNVGDYIHNGYCRMKILGHSIYKGYSFVVVIDCADTDCSGAKKLNRTKFNISYKATAECYLVK